VKTFFHGKSENKNPCFCIMMFVETERTIDIHEICSSECVARQNNMASCIFHAGQLIFLFLLCVTFPPIVLFSPGYGSL